MVRIQERRSLEREKQRIYATPNTFINQLGRDVENVHIWFDENTFAKWREVDGVRILTVLTKGKNSPLFDISQDASGVLSLDSEVLYCKAKDIKRRPRMGTVVNVDGVTYQVRSAFQTLGGTVWAIELGSCE